MRKDEEIAAGPCKGAAAGEDGREVSARSRDRPGPRPLVTRERLTELLEILERAIARRWTERRPTLLRPIPGARGTRP